ncbi:MAG TPA: hypothetical protein VK176_13145 [Phycisphaerales bacterium]|nr:hypothetical protein [Phycisphaerales bacterium]
MTDFRTTRRASAALDRLRRFRPRPPAPPAVGELTDQWIKGLRKQSTRQETVHTILLEILNERLMSGLVIVKVHGDAVHLRAGHPTQRFSVDRALTQEQARQRLARAGVARIRWTSRG